MDHRFDHGRRLVTGADRLSEGERGQVFAALAARGDVYAAVESILAARTAQAHADGWNEARAELLPTLDALKAERDAALAAVAGIEEVARRVLGEHRVGPATGGTSTGSEVGCSCGAIIRTATGTRHYADQLGRAHQAERIASELRGEG